MLNVQSESFIMWFQSTILVVCSIFDATSGCPSVHLSVRLSLVEIIYFRCKSKSNQPIDLKLGLNVGKEQCISERILVSKF